MVIKSRSKKTGLHVVAFFLDTLPLWLGALFYYMQQLSAQAHAFSEEAVITWPILGVWFLYHLLNELLLPRRKGGTWGQLLLKLKSLPKSFNWWRVLIAPVLLVAILFWKNAHVQSTGVRVNVSGDVTLQDLGAKGPAKMKWTEAQRAQFHERCMGFLLHSTSSLLGGMDLILTDDLKAKLAPEMRKNCQCQLEEIEKSALGDEFLEQGLASEEAYQTTFQSEDNAFEILSITQRCQVPEN